MGNFLALLIAHIFGTPVYSEQPAPAPIVRTTEELNATSWSPPELEIPTADWSKPAQRPLHLCPDCWGDLVYPVQWQEREDDKWWIELRCPNCERVEAGEFDHDIVEEFDRALNRGTDVVIERLEVLERENFVHDILVFQAASEADQVWPEDFGVRDAG